MTSLLNCEFVSLHYKQILSGSISDKVAAPPVMVVVLDHICCSHQYHHLQNCNDDALFSNPIYSVYVIMQCFIQLLHQQSRPEPPGS